MGSIWFANKSKHVSSQLWEFCKIYKNLEFLNSQIYFWDESMYCVSRLQILWLVSVTNKSTLYIPLESSGKNEFLLTSIEDSNGQFRRRGGDNMFLLKLLQILMMFAIHVHYFSPLGMQVIRVVLPPSMNLRIQYMLRWNVHDCGVFLLQR